MFKVLEDHPTVREAVSATPPVAASSLYLFGYPLNDMLLVITAVYTLLLISEKLIAMWQRWKNRKDNHDKSND